MSSLAISQILMLPGQGKAVSFGGLHEVFKIRSEDSGGLFSLTEHVLDPGRLIPPHMHTREDEYAYVLEGEIGVRVGDEVLWATPGCVVFKPRNVPHTFWNSGSVPAKVLGIYSPGNFEKYHEEVPQAFGPQGPDFAKLSALRERFGVVDVLEWVPELTAKYGVKMLGQE